MADLPLPTPVYYYMVMPCDGKLIAGVFHYEESFLGRFLRERNMRVTGINSLNSNTGEKVEGKKEH
jgi:hypothetical protein